MEDSIQLKNTGHVLFLLLLFMIAAGVFQDVFHAARNNYAFYLSESLLFKTFWLCFLPLFLLFSYGFTNIKNSSNLQCGLLVVGLICLHVLLVTLIISGLSVVFFDHGYSLGKVFTYTMSNDLLTLILIYGAFVFMYKYTTTTIANIQPTPQQITVKAGNQSVRIKLKDIILIQAATPYISIQLAKKKLLLTTTLKSFQQQLDERFIRVHKSSIVNSDHVIACQSRMNGDYDLIMSDTSHVRLSRNYVADYRQRFQPSPPLKA
jgi:two-component system LytT family response regulator